ncbi:MAG: Gfo/Idh/MocA family oxidoreductase [Oscillospiraceae bacterium]|nr:Gfo/Idh/MocA family oxidoreductase [Oscillospiraceae bacterium]
MGSILDKFKEVTEEIKDYTKNDKIRVGIIGCGWIAEAHAKAYMQCPDVEIVGLADLIDGKCESFCDMWGLDKSKINFYPSHKELLDNEPLDCVSVCTYNATHAECTIYALQKGVNVLLEKPMCVTLDEAVAICKAEKESGKILSIGFQPRFDRNMQQIKKIVDACELGRVYYIQTGGGRRRGIPAYNGTFLKDETAGVGALGDIGCYSLDMVLNAVGYPTPLTVTGFKGAYFGKDPQTYIPRRKNPEYLARIFTVDDFAGGLIRLEGGIILDFRISWAMNMDTPGDTLILGTKAGLRILSTNCWNGSVGGPMTVYWECAGQSVETVLPILKDSPGDGDLWDRKIGSFVTAIREGGPAPVPSSQIIKNQAIIDGVVRSAELGREVEIHIPEI